MQYNNYVKLHDHKNMVQQLVKVFYQLITIIQLNNNLNI
jgi:hypothetical protein